MLPSEPSGTILMWSGLESEINWRWKLCNGLAGTPDLRNLFIVGAGSSYAKGATGGAMTHSHTIIYPTHCHDIAIDLRIKAGGNFSIYTGSTIPTGSLGSAASINPYYALCYIQKK